jgi:PAS domain S-box-containing protein
MIMGQLLKILHIEDNQADFQLITRHLRQQGMDTECFRVDCMEMLERALAESEWDLILADFNVPGLNFYDSFAFVHAQAPNLPIILVSGNVGEEQAVELLKLGVWDFVLKDNLTRLVPAVMRALMDATEYRARHAAAEALRESERRFQDVVNSSKDWIWEIDDNQRYIYASRSVERLLGYTVEEILGKTPFDLMLPEESELLKNKFFVFAASKETFHELPNTKISKNGSIRHLLSSGIPVLDTNGDLKGYRGLNRDITEQKLSEETLRKLYMAVAQSPVIVMITDLEGIIEFVNPCFCRISGYTFDEAQRKHISFVTGNDSDESLSDLWKAIHSGCCWEGDIHNKSKAGTSFWVHATISPIRNENGIITHLLAVKEDITERRNLEDQLRQAQKMEAIGQLAGGLAHDFNNMLQVLLGNIENLIAGKWPKDVTGDKLEDMRKAILKSAALTRHLLAFARKQPVLPKVLDFNATIVDMLSVLIRLVGDNVDLRFTPGSESSLVKMDPTQIDQILANLAVNADAAIDGHGKLYIQTDNVIIDTTFCRSCPEATPGQYVLLSISDDGCGMDTKTLESVFEPFFTTKSMAESTGLGLATVYGIVKQNKGFLQVSSQVGCGTTFRIYLPRASGETIEVSPESDPEPEMMPGGGQTILLVEDDDPVRMVTADFLENYGYNVLQAATPDEAIQISETNPAIIDLLITDIVMPGISGPELARKMTKRISGLKFLFISGYTSDFLEHKGDLQTDMPFLLKPYSGKELADKVRDMLDSSSLVSL